MTRTGIIGPGLIWQKTHRAIIREMADSFTVTAFSARSEASLTAAQKDFPEARTYTRYQDLIADPQVDAVVALTPILLNAPVAMDILRAGKHAIVEKPMASSLDEARTLIETERSSAGRLFILEQAVYKPVVARVVSMVKSGSAGEIQHFEYTIHTRIGSGSQDTTGGFGDTHWRIETQFPLGSLFDAGIHDLAMLQMIFGPPKEVFAAGSNVRPDFGEADTVTAIFRYSPRMDASFVHSGVLPKRRDAFFIRGTGAVLEIRDSRIRRWYGIDSFEDETLEASDPSRLMWSGIADALATGKNVAYTSETSLADLKTLFAIQRSIKSGHWESI